MIFHSLIYQIRNFFAPDRRNSWFFRVWWARYLIFRVWSMRLAISPHLIDEIKAFSVWFTKFASFLSLIGKVRDFFNDRHSAKYAISSHFFFPCSQQSLQFFCAQSIRFLILKWLTKFSIFLPQPDEIYDFFFQPMHRICVLFPPL